MDSNSPVRATITNFSLPAGLRVLELRSSDLSFLRATDTMSFSVENDDHKRVLHHGGFTSVHTLEFKDFKIDCTIFGKDGESLWDIETRIKRVFQVGTDQPLRLELSFGGQSRFIDVRPLSFTSDMDGASAAMNCVKFTCNLRAVLPWWQSSVERYVTFDGIWVPSSTSGGINFGSGGFNGGADFSLVNKSVWTVENNGSVVVPPTIGVDVHPSSPTSGTVLGVRIVAGSSYEGDTSNGIRLKDLQHNWSVFVPEPTPGFYRVNEPDEVIDVTASGKRLENWAGNVTTAGTSDGVRLVPVLHPGPSTVSLHNLGTAQYSGAAVVVYFRWRDRWH